VDGGSPLPLAFTQARDAERQRTAAVQDAVAFFGRPQALCALDLKLAKIRSSRQFLLMPIDVCCNLLRSCVRREVDPLHA